MSDKPGLLVMALLPQRDLDAMAARFTLLKLYEAPETAAFLAEHGASVRAVATKGENGIDAATLAQLPHCGIVGCYGVGVDAIDQTATRARGIPVTNTPDVLTEEVADMAMALLLAAARRIPAGDAWVRNGDWKRASMPLTTRVYGKRLGIVGLGNIGRAVARRAEAFRMPISYSGRTPKADVPYAYYPSPEALAPHVDVMLVCAMGGATTRGLVTAAAIGALRPGAIFVNVSRGTVVDEAALLAALNSGAIAAAGLDVFLNEPDIDPGFLLPHVVLQPHNASGTIETRNAMGDLLLANLEAHIDGKPLLTPLP
ncbi:D-3-phosphoglycerate dehydrogenase [Humitalea rosea]|uniref:D-3-phosphoglycerate dehydrogenase n=1 Tax=Humitalea rosea TaxID=990373 RepID=A0A2W7J9Q1_9PROT|nr:2-hydroxyacid dehydrogenase [Humitalea rosea]PZW48712.1 D-3-phosphoglycerate dehydrogenase [Humitalea rosea]